MKNFSQTCNLNYKIQNRSVVCCNIVVTTFDRPLICEDRWDGIQTQVLC